MFARKTLLARLAASAASLAARSASAACFCPLMSRTVACRNRSPSSSMRVSSTEAKNSRPSLRRWVHSKKWEPSARAAAIICWAFNDDGDPSA